MNRDEMRDRISKAIRKGAPSDDIRPSYRTADVVLDAVWPEVERLQALTAECTCGGSYETYGGPEPDCAVHGVVRALHETQGLLDQARMDCQATTDEAERHRRAAAAHRAGEELLESQLNALAAEKDAEIERLTEEVRREIDEDIIIPERRMHEETIDRAERAEAKQQAVADLIARARRRPGNAFVPIELLEIAAADQPTEAVTGLHAAIRAVLTSHHKGVWPDPPDLDRLARAYESATGWTAEERT
jgi:hypothetical protein